MKNFDRKKRFRVDTFEVERKNGIWRGRSFKIKLDNWGKWSRVEFSWSRFDFDLILDCFCQRNFKDLEYLLTNNLSWSNILWQFFDPLLNLNFVSSRTITWKFKNAHQSIYKSNKLISRENHRQIIHSFPTQK